MPNPLLIGPISQLLTMNNLPASGPIADASLEIIPDAAVLVRNSIIEEVGSYLSLKKKPHDIMEIDFPAVALPGLIDTHTHICFAGSRAADYALRVSGMSYLEISERGGGILDTVRKTRMASKEELTTLTVKRALHLLQQGVTTCEVKSGYGLTVDDEIKILRAIKEASKQQPVDLVSTCLAAHIRPPEFSDNTYYLNYLAENLFPVLLNEELTSRIDIFVEKNAFSTPEAKTYLKAAIQLGFHVCVHADQFSRSGALLAAELNALSADHLEQSSAEDFLALKKAGVIPIVLPGASLGLGMPMPPARAILDSGLPLVIASDWNPGSAPMGNLLAQAAILGANQHLTMAETLAALTSRAAKALKLNDRGILKPGHLADITLFPCGDFREILYHQGALWPALTLKRGLEVYHS